MSLAAGQNLSHYRLVEKIGEGGMGIVWKAEDTKLDREVAIKILPAELASDPERLGRFEREAKAIAALDHPNIVTVHSVEEAEGIRFITMGLVRGNPLTELIPRNGLPLGEFFNHAIALADAISEAHQQGITHRDLKPDNVMVGDDGRLKVLDFGLAKLREEARSVDGTQMPTATVTQEGKILGTVSYMSPEQAEGKAIDHRSDIFSLGVMLYQMATGQRPFKGDTVVSIVSSIVKDAPPPVSELKRSLPRHLGRIVRRCLSKELQRRYQSALDLRNELEELKEEIDSGEVPLTGTEPVAGRRLGLRRPTVGLWALLALVLAAGLVIGGFALRPRSTPGPPIIRTLTFSGMDAEPAASPDGKTLAFASMRDGVSRIWLKQLAEGSEVPLTSGHDFSPRFSPDGSAILFTREVANGMVSLYRVPVLGGEPRMIVPDALAGDWSPEGDEIAFVRLGEEHGASVALLGLASIDGGSERIIQAIENSSLDYPRFSPDGKWIGCIRFPLNTVEGEGGYQIILARTDGEEVRRLIPLEEGGLISAMAWLGTSGEVIYSQGESAAVMMVGRASLLETGANRIVRQNIKTGEGSILFWSPSLSRVLDVVVPGKIVYESISSAQNLREYEIAAGAEAQGVLLSQGASLDRQPVYSPDGEWLAYSSNRAGNLDVWARSMRDGSTRRLTDHPTLDFDPAFTPDGNKILFSSRRGGNIEIWTANLDGGGARQVTRDGVDAENGTATANGEWIVYSSGNPEKRGLWKIRPDGTDATRLVNGSCAMPEVSPDGRYVSYMTTRESALAVVHVARVEDGEVLPFEILIPGSGFFNGRTRWMPDGRAIAFTWTTASGSGIYTQDFVPGEDTTSTRRPLIEFAPGGMAESFAISPDGKRFTVSGLVRSWSLTSAENLAGVTPPSR